jgi:hypothetical protein
LSISCLAPGEEASSCEEEVSDHDGETEFRFFEVC